MSQKRGMLEIPDVIIVPTEQLKVDGDNPNRMTPKQLASLKRSILNWGFIVPIVTNKDLLIADGEQRLTAARELGMTEVPVVCLNVEDVDRRLLRQVLNKIRGEHNLYADALEFDKIVKAGREDDLKIMLDLNDDQIDRYFKLIREPKEETYETPKEIQTDIQRGDIYQLGNHQLICGDATDPQDVEKLLNNQKADLFFLDPPYGMQISEATFNFYMDLCNTFIIMNSDRESVKYAARSSFFRYFLIGRRYSSSQ